MVKTSQPLNSTSIMVNNVSRSNTNGIPHEDGLSSGGSGLMSSPSRF
jgi:hypothetical protein